MKLNDMPPWTLLVGPFVMIIVMAALGALFGPDKASVTEKTEKRVTLDDLNKQQKQEVLGQTILDMQWEKGGFDNVMLVDFTIKNKSTVPFKDFTVTCNYKAASGTLIDQNTKTIYETVPAHSTKKMKNFNMGFINSQAQSASCTIVDLVTIGQAADEYYTDSDRNIHQRPATP